MAGFNAEGIVEPLAYNLRPFVDAEGVIREPTSAQVRAFNLAARDEIQKLSAEIVKAGEEVDDLPGLAGVAAVLETLSMRSAALSEEAVHRQAVMLSALCSGHPTAGQLEKLPYRIMAALAQWLTGEVMNPEASTGGGDAQVINLKSSAAG